MREDPAAGLQIFGSTSQDVALAHLAAIVQGSGDAIVSKTLDGIVTSWNPSAERIFGWTAEEMVGQSITRVIPPELQGEEDEILARMRRGERIGHFDTVRVTKEGRRIDISVTISPIRNQAGVVVGASKVARDITERRRAEQLQTLLFEELNHRVKNLLALIQALASQSLRRASSPADFVAGFSGRIQALARAHELLVQSRMQGSTLADLVREQVLLGRAPDGRVEVEGPPLLLKPAPTVQLGLVLHELATNARKYGALAGEQGRLRITWRIEGRELLIDWQESGGPSRPATPRAGFGTALIERALEAHGGQALLEHAPEGTRCRIRLPLQIEEPALPRRLADRPPPPPRAADATLEGPALTGLRVLVVEDEALIAMELEVELGNAGCHVVGPVSSVAEALRLLETRAVDLALLDANLAGQPVDALAAALRARSVPFAFATGYGRDALPAGFRDVPVLAKPFGRLQVLGMLRSLLRAPQGEAPAA